MNTFDALREKLDKKKVYFQKFYEAEGKTKADADLNKATQLAFDDAIEIVNQVEQEYKPKTNADCIRAMSDEELTEFLSENTNCDCCNIQCPDKLNCPSMSSCYCRHLEWLQREVDT